MTATTLDDLAVRLADEPDRGFPDLVDALHGPVFAGVFRLVGHYHDAEELTQETFVRAHRALHRYPPDQVRTLRLRPWLWTIALNLCRNHARGRGRRPATAGLETVAEPASPDLTDEAALGPDPEWSRRLAALPAHLRRAVVLRHVVGLDYEEIAAAVDRPVGTVKSDVHRGIDRLRRMLVDEATGQGATS